MLYTQTIQIFIFNMEHNRDVELGYMYTQEDALIVS